MSYMEVFQASLIVFVVGAYLILAIYLFGHAVFGRRPAVAYARSAYRSILDYDDNGGRSISNSSRAP
ncbi:MAG TPA: hypothetical protein VJX67_18540, partial [Blastocatellia bacterium]|nr:hypothetical protein [Blastocatellia bacterium]